MWWELWRDFQSYWSTLLELLDLYQVLAESQTHEGALVRLENAV